MKKFWLAGLAAALFTLFSACNDQNSSIGLGLTNQLGTDFTDTVTVSAYSLLEDTISTTNMTANLIGEIHDPVFGDCKASTYAQFDLTGTSVNFGEAPVIDSVILTLQLASYYGDTNSRVGIRIYQLTEEISATNYNSASTIAYDATPLNYTLTDYTIQPTTNVIVDTGLNSPHIRIRLSQAFGQYLLDNQAQMTSNAAFKNFFKGLCLSTESHTGSTGYMILTSLTSALSGISLYYHNSTTPTTKYVFPCNTECMRFTNYSHDYSASSDVDFVQEVIQGDTSIGGRKLFLQATGGVKTKITFPHLRDSFKELDKRVVINRAELVITDISPEEVYLIHPAALTLQGIKENGSITYLPDDDVYTSESYFGGTYDEDKHEYRFRITEYIQNQIHGVGDLTNSIYLVVNGAAVRANRLIAGGTDASNGESRLRLELSYTSY